MNPLHGILLSLAIITAIGFVIFLSVKLEKKEEKCNKKEEEKKFTETEKNFENALKMKKAMEKMTENPCLEKSEKADIKINSGKALPEDYEQYFSEFKTKNIVYPKIDLLFEELLKSEVPPKAKTVREFLPKIEDMPIIFFQAWFRPLEEISLSANEILKTFIESKRAGGVGKENWFLLNIRLGGKNDPHKPYIPEDFKMVCIFSVENTEKYCIYCYPYKRWSVTFGGCIDVKSKFFIPIESAPVSQ